jgi:membrane protein DedA with SNARE-associated domain
VIAHDCCAIVVLFMLGSVGLPIPDEPLLVCIGDLRFKGDLSAPLLTALHKEVHRCLNV